MVALAAIGLVLVCVVVVAVSAVMVMLLPAVFFSPPEHHQFASQAERAASALTRLTALQLVALPALLLAATYRSRGTTDPLRRKFYRGRDLVPRRGWRVGLAALVICSTAVSVAATLGQPGGLAAAAAAVVAYGCLGWLVLAVARRMTAVRLPGGLCEPSIQVAAVVVPLALLAPAVSVLYSPSVLHIAGYLSWLGPPGWINAALQQISLGQFQVEKLVQLGFLSAAMGYVGYELRRRTKRWSFRRRLLRMYRAERLSRTGSALRPASRQTLAHEVRTEIAGSSGPARLTVFVPPWLSGHGKPLALLAAAQFVVQLIFSAMALFLWRLEQAADVAQGDAVPEKLMAFALTSNVAGWSVLIHEGYFLLVRDAAKLIGFSKRPVSPVEIWWDLHRRGLRTVPMQLLLAIPFLAIPIYLGHEYWNRGLASVGLALAACFAIRTAVSAAACYLSATVVLRPLIAAPLQWLGWVACIGLLPIVVAPIKNGGPVEPLTSLLMLMLASGLAFGLGWGMWQFVSRPRRALRGCW